MQPTSKSRTASLRLPEVLKRIPVSKSTWWAGVRAGRYPQPIHIGLRITAWREEDIDDLIKHGLSASVENDQRSGSVR